MWVTRPKVATDAEVITILVSMHIHISTPKKKKKKKKEKRETDWVNQQALWSTTKQTRSIHSLLLFFLT